jgi:hypothetical protein
MAPSQAPAASPESLVNFFNYSRLPEAHCASAIPFYRLSDAIAEKIGRGQHFFF